MNETISNLQYEGDIKITILQYLSSFSTPQIEIEHIKAKHNISLVIDQYFHRSPDYMAILARIKLAKEKLAGITDYRTDEFKEKLKFLQDLYKLEESFKVDVLNLADMFLRLSIKSERLVTAKKLFEEGRIKDADAILVEEDIVKDQNDLVLAAEYWEHRKADILGLLSSMKEK